MKYEAGLNICEKIITALSSSKEYEDRIEDAIYEAGGVEREYVSEESYKILKELIGKYNFLNNDINPDFGEELADVCFEIIKNNGYEFIKAEKEFDRDKEG